MQTFSCSFKSNSASFPYSIHTLYFPWNELVNLATKSCYTKNSWPLDSSIYSWLGKMLTLHTNSRFILLFTQWSNRKSYRLRNPRNNWSKQQEADCQETTRAKDLHYKSTHIKSLRVGNTERKANNFLISAIFKVLLFCDYLSCQKPMNKHKISEIAN